MRISRLNLLPRIPLRCAMFAGIAAVALLNAACGLKGPLYMPDETPDGVPASEAGANQAGKRPLPPAPQSQKKDRSTAPAIPVIDPDRPAAPAGT